ncbi:hypothetical protein JL2886_02992 [Phaeobacter gallaeciensis]|uniref:Uncharacterized protein n=1 Tax=Phaeobacter gallaeciensis TaxID=60890 RepID=A0A1B0ZUV6_9RHOB|nr:hypothetical protein JL2886_02992 [Phaeobacter gallaeciensis]
MVCGGWTAPVAGMMRAQHGRAQPILRHLSRAVDHFNK